MIAPATAATMTAQREGVPESEHASKENGDLTREHEPEER